MRNNTNSKAGIPGKNKLRYSTLAVITSLALSGISFAANAAGLGRVVVFSALGQPLRAEVEVIATPDELSGMSARLASPDAFRSAGLDYASSLLNIKFTLDKKKSGKTILMLTSDKPLNDPFVDMLVELNWSSGRLVREFTFLLDPPEIKPAGEVSAPTAASPVPPTIAITPPAAKSEPRTVESVPPRTVEEAHPATVQVVEGSAATIDSETRKRAQEAMQQKSAAVPKEAVKETAKAPASSAAKEMAGTHQIKSGETLNKIANEYRPAGISLEQMLVGIYQANPEAFQKNMNRMKSGQILNVPDKASLESVSTPEAKKIVVAQAADWNRYRSRLAEAAGKSTATEGEAQSSASGVITPKVEDKGAATAPSRDKVQIAKAEAGQPQGKGISEADRVAQEKALKDAGERVKEVEATNAKLKELADKRQSELDAKQRELDITQKRLAELQEQLSKAQQQPPAPVQPHPAATTSTTTEAAPVPVPVSTPESTPTMAGSETTVQQGMEGSTQPEVSQPQQTSGGETPTPEPVPASEEPKQAPLPVQQETPAQNMPEEQGLLDGIDPMLVGGGALLVAALVGGGLYLRRKRQQSASVEDLSQTSVGTLSQSSLGASSIFRTTGGGQSVDTSHLTHTTDFSQVGPGTIDTGEVDPVAEADVYMAYGRDAQAEEILLEAKTKTPGRLAIHLKLLDIYASRQDLKQFEALAGELYGITKGTGSEWEKAAALGAQLDPSNPLFNTGRAVPTTAVSGVATTQAARVPEFAPEFDMPLQAPSALAPRQPVQTGSQPAPQPVPPRPVVPAPVRETVPAAASNPEFIFSDLPAGRGIPELGDQGDEGTDTNITGTQVGFDLSDEPVSSQTSQILSIKQDEPLDFDFDAQDVATDIKAPEPKPVQAAPAVSVDTSIEPLDFGTASDFGVASNSTESAAETSQPGGMATAHLVDSVIEPQMTSINLDLAAPEIAETEFYTDNDVPQSLNDELATKLDLAKAYEEMGDMEGARELLQEVFKEGDAAYQEKARAALDRIGG